MSRLCWSFVLVFLFDIFHAVAELNRISYCIAADSDYFEVSAVSIVTMLWAKGRTSRAHKGGLGLPPLELDILQKLYKTSA